ncbi:MAG: PilW family protein [Xenococcaceae cyanobacterium]
MTAHFLKAIIGRLSHFYRRSKVAGFTLTELLATTVIATTIISSLMWLMIDMGKTNQLETAYNETQQDMKRALDYIADDLREAVFVYTGTQLKDRPDDLNGVKDNLPNFGNGVEPIIAFWKVERLPNPPSESDCEALSSAKQEECKDLNIERRTYTLVVYLQSTANPNGIWTGKSRIERYELTKYSNVSTLTHNDGYVDPSKENKSFKRWPYDANSTNLQQGTPHNNTDVLVDFVDDPTNDPSGGNLPTCSGDYERTPIDDTNSKSFFACVRVAEMAGQAFNQDIILFLRGNAQGKPGVTNDSFLSFVQTQVTNRGVIEKQVAD